jgi:hypothetical protein
MARHGIWLCCYFYPQNKSATAPARRAANEPAGARPEAALVFVAAGEVLVADGEVLVLGVCDAEDKPEVDNPEAEVRLADERESVLKVDERDAVDDAKLDDDELSLGATENEPV